MRSTTRPTKTIEYEGCRMKVVVARNLTDGMIFIPSVLYNI
jgi:hypothetical protein